MHIVGIGDMSRPEECRILLDLQITNKEKQFHPSVLAYRTSYVGSSYFNVKNDVVRDQTLVVKATRSTSHSLFV